MRSLGKMCVKKILFISTQVPTRLGGMRSLYYNMLAFSEFFEVHFILVKAGEVEKRVLFEMPKWVKSSALECSGNSFCISDLLFPLQWREMGRIRAAQEKVQNYIDANGIDAVVMHSMDVTFALGGVRAGVKSGYQLDSFASYYISKWKFARSLQAFLLAMLQVVLSRLMMGELLKNYGLLAYVSNTDTGGMPKEKVCIVSQCRDKPAKKPGLGRRGIDVVLFGRWEHPPNRDGLLRILGDLGKVTGSVKIIGPNFNAVAQLPKNVEYLGMVEDIESCWENSKVCIMPVWYGAGLQTKLFDALRHGCKVVTTEYTKRTFEANWFFAKSVVYAQDLAVAANQALATWNAKDALAAYEDYGAFYRISRKQEKEYVERILELCKTSG